MKFKSVEAFAMMQYHNDETEDLEWIWNSRDGVTPFVVTSRDGKTELTHRAWEFDMRILHWVPNVGDRVFVDVTGETAMRAHLHNMVARTFGLGRYPVDTARRRDAIARFGSPDGMKEALLPGLLDEVKACQPDLVVVTRKMQKRFLVERQERMNRPAYEGRVGLSKAIDNCQAARSRRAELMETLKFAADRHRALSSK